MKTETKVAIIAVIFMLLMIAFIEGYNTTMEENDTVVVTYDPYDKKNIRQNIEIFSISQYAKNDWEIKIEQSYLRGDIQDRDGWISFQDSTALYEGVLNNMIKIPILKNVIWSERSDTPELMYVKINETYMNEVIDLFGYSEDEYQNRNKLIYYSDDLSESVSFFFNDSCLLKSVTYNKY